MNLFYTIGQIKFETIGVPMLVIGITALVMGTIIAIIFKLFAVKEDKRFEELLEIMPGVNCGGCGYSGCAGYAEALANGTDLDCAKCTAGGVETAEALADYMGFEQPAYVPKVAQIACQGTCEHTERRYDYTGSDSCLSAHNLFSGPNACIYGCMGLGDCKVACEFGAIEIKDGIAQIIPERCTACGKCVEACPKHIISIKPKYKQIFQVRCSNPKPGKNVRSVCDIGCIGCRRCVKACEYGAITMEDALAVIDPEKCVHCGACEPVCPTKAIVIGLRIPQAKGAE